MTPCSAGHSLAPPAAIRSQMCCLPWVRPNEASDASSQGQVRSNSSRSFIRLFADPHWRGAARGRDLAAGAHGILVLVAERVGLLHIDVAVAEWADGAIDSLAAVRRLAWHSLKMLAQAAILQRCAGAVVDRLLRLLALAGLRHFAGLGGIAGGQFLRKRAALVHHAHGVTST